jgi:signal transduction histidine kinase
MLNQHWRPIAKSLAEIQQLPLPPDARDRVEQVMRDMEWDFLQQDVEKMIKSIATGAERMAQIVQNLRTFSRLDAGRREDVDVREGIESTLQILHHRYKDRIAIERDYQATPTIVGSPGQLNQVFMNILHNAIQAIDGKGAIRITTRVVRDRLRVSIADTGVGIDPADVLHVFDPFFTTKKVGEGTGLGLSISYGIVEDHGGRLWLESEKGKGSVFHIDLPLPPAKEMARGA